MLPASASATSPPFTFRLIFPEQFAAVLREFVAGKSGYLFKTRSGQPWGQRDFLRALHNGGADCGFHAFRRFRTETLKSIDVPWDIINGWLGWRAEGMAGRYGEGLKKNEARRRQWVETVGVGFSLNGLQRVTKGYKRSLYPIIRGCVSVSCGVN